MADLIDRKDALAKLIALRKDNAEYSCENDIMRGKDIAYENAMDFIARTPAVNRWIPYSEKRPDLWCEYLTHNAENGAMYVLTFSPADNTFGIYDGNVTHWMPLPKTPEVIENAGID